MTMQSSMGRPLERVDARAKVCGTARYAGDHPLESPAYACLIQATVARGRVVGLDIDTAAQVDGVLGVLTHENAPRLANTDDAELSPLQSDRVAFRGQVVGVVIADTRETAQHAAALVDVEYDAHPHDTQLRENDPDAYVSAQDSWSPSREEAGEAQDGRYSVDRTYTTPMEHNNPMEPHVTAARWDPDADVRLTLWDSTQGAHAARDALAPVVGLEPDQIRVVASHVGGGFGSKGLPHVHDVIAVMCAQVCVGRSVTLALTRQQTFTLGGHRSPTMQRVRLDADAEGLLLEVEHEATAHGARLKEFAEQPASMTQMMYATPRRRTLDWMLELDVPVPSWMRAPGVCPGFFALEVAMDELAEACGLDPVELRRRNEPAVDPENGRPWSDRRLLECFEEGRRRFGWTDRGRPGDTRDGQELVGLGVAASTYPFHTMSGSRARVRYDHAAGYTVSIGAVDIGTGARTALGQIAADALGAPVGDVAVEIGDTDLPSATVAGGSSGLSCWGSAVVTAVRDFRERYGNDPVDGADVLGSEAEVPSEEYSRHSFGAQFAEARVDVDTGEVRVSRMLGVFSAGRIVNERTARSQFVGGMTMGISMALHEHGIFDHTTGHIVNHDLAQYHVATHADIGDVRAHWLPEPDPHTNAFGGKGIGEIGIVGAAAAVANAVYQATGVRVRDLPVTPDHLVG